MAIMIKTEKIVRRGEKRRRIESIEGVMDVNEVPKDYLEGYPKVIPLLGKSAGIYVTDDGGTENLKPGQIISEVKFQKILERIKEAGERLHRERQKEKDLMKRWYGEETFII